MLSRSATREPLAHYNQPGISPSSSDESHLRPLPFPVISRASSRASTASYSSTAALNPNHAPRKNRESVAQKLFGWTRHAETQANLEAQHTDKPCDKGGGAQTTRLRPWHGWRLIIFDSWLNFLIFLIPVAGILKATTDNSETLVFTACLLAMIPLVKLHDVATGVLSRRIGGNKTGLLNSSMSNIVEMVVAVIALRKCELRVVQSSLVGAMLSKLLLILGMCFFAGGTRFSEQGFDSTATQIHSSLLSISVGAVLLPAAFHFALSYNTEDSAEEAGTTLREQKSDILRMSHGVAIVLLFIYASYLVFQLWSHTHLYKDSTQPSSKLPAAESVRYAATRVRQKSNNLREHLASNHPLRRMRSGSSLRTLQSIGYPRPSKAARSSEKITSVPEVPETSIDDENSERGSTVRRGPYMPRAVSEGTRAMLVSPFGTASQVTLSNPIARPAESTVRLVPEHERTPFRRENSGSGSRHASRSPSPLSRVGSGEDSSFDDEDEGWRRARERGRSRTPMSEVLSAYYEDGGNFIESEGRWASNDMTDVDIAQRNGPGPWQHGRDASMQSLQSRALPAKEQEELSWTLTIFLLLSVTALVALNAEWLVDTMDHLSPTISKEWIGLILLPTVSSIAECVTAVNVSVQDQLTLSISVAVGSTIQTALFVIPSMVILGWITDKPLALLFDPFESVVLYISVHTMGYVVADGKSNWLEGVILVCLYVVIAVTFWFYPGSNFSSNLAICTESPPIAL
ncbi:Sodium/calcium exchanger protein-domain-containing protein [Lenzites betulinus]|nr:Sodium/calcium exchanger protein-domain-containing protein [Lenzites betulinus]